MLRSSGHLRFAQDLAWVHSESAGFGREWYAERQLTWLVRGVELDILEDTEYGSELVVSTEVVGFRRVIARRRSEFHRSGAERPLAIAITDWVLLNATGRPVRPPADILEVFVGQTDAFSPLRVHLGAAASGHAQRPFRVRRSETDPMGHVNNAAYLDYLDERYLATFEAPLTAGLPLPRRYHAEFTGSALAHDEVNGEGWQADMAWCYRLTGADEREIFRATLEVDPATWIGG